MSRVVRQFVLRAAEPRPGTPIDRAARGAVAARGRDLLRAYEQTIGQGRCGGRGVHVLRSSTRRLEATVHAVEPCLDRGRLDRLLKLTRRARRRAGLVRDADVLSSLAIEVLPAGTARDRWLADLSKRRRRAAGKLRELQQRQPVAKVRSRLGRVSRDATVPEGQRTWADAWDDAAVKLLREVRARASEDITRDDSLHALRIELKRLRYALEIFRACLRTNDWVRLTNAVKALVDLFGRFNDASVLAAELADEAPSLKRAANAHLNVMRAEVLRTLRTGALDRVLAMLASAARYAPPP